MPSTPALPGSSPPCTRAPRYTNRETGRYTVGRGRAPRKGKGRRKSCPSPPDHYTKRFTFLSGGLPIWAHHLLAPLRDWLGRLTRHRPRSPPRPSASPSCPLLSRTRKDQPGLFGGGLPRVQGKLKGVPRAAAFIVRIISLQVTTPFASRSRNWCRRRSRKSCSSSATVCRSAPTSEWLTCPVHGSDVS